MVAATLLPLPALGALSDARVLADETITTTIPANNGSNPMWSNGAPLLVRENGNVWASISVTDLEAKPACNTHWELWRRPEAGAWERARPGPAASEREPCPLFMPTAGELMLSIHPKILERGRSSSEERLWYCQPAIAKFDPADHKKDPKLVQPEFAGRPGFNQHTYRSVAVDATNGSFLMMSIDTSMCTFPKSAAAFCGLALSAALAAEPDYQTKGVVDRLPVCTRTVQERGTRPLSWTSGRFNDFAMWRDAARAKVFSSMLAQPPSVPWAAEVIEEEDRGTHVARKIVFNLTGDSRVLAYMTVPKGAGPFPAVLLLHDHGAKFDIGKEKVIRPWNIDPAKQKSAEEWAVQNYGGRGRGGDGPRTPPRALGRPRRRIPTSAATSTTSASSRAPPSTCPSMCAGRCSTRAIRMRHRAPARSG